MCISGLHIFMIDIHEILPRGTWNIRARENITLEIPILWNAEVLVWVSGTSGKDGHQESKREKRTCGYCSCGGMSA